MMGVPWAHEAWNEIIPSLWQGGLHYQSPESEFIDDALPHSEFDLVVSMHPKPNTGPAEGVEHWRGRIPDGVLDTEDWRLVDDAVDRVLAALNDEKRVLVRCQAGYNRSGLVVAMVLLTLGYGADEAIALIREKRSKWALCNRHFVTYIREAAEGLSSTDTTSEVDHG